MAQPSEYSAFISYASADSGKAQEICAHLEARGLRCWIAPRDVRAGREYANEIIGGIERSRSLVLVLSAAANESAFVRREVERAVTKGRPVLPVRVEPVLPSQGLELFVSATHWIDAWKGDWTDHMERLTRDLAEGPLTGAPADHLVSRTDTAGDASWWNTRRVLSAAAVLLVLVLAAAAGYWYEADDAVTPLSADRAAPLADGPVRTPAAESEPREAPADRGANTEAARPPAATPQNPTVAREPLRNVQATRKREPPPPQPTAAAPHVEPSAPAHQPAELEALEQLRQQGTALTLRAQVVDASLNRLAEQMRPYGLRNDVALRQQSLASSLASGQRALDQRNIAAATKYFDVARSDVEMLERFLGR